MSRRFGNTAYGDLRDGAQHGASARRIGAVGGETLRGKLSWVMGLFRWSKNLEQMVARRAAVAVPETLCSPNVRVMAVRFTRAAGTNRMANRTGDEISLLSIRCIVGAAMYG